MILCIETATKVCSVALCDRTGVLAWRESIEGRSHASDLTPFIVEVLAEKNIEASQLDAVAVSKGPGSYTGLRIGVSTAKGIAYAASKPLIAVDTLYSMFYGAIEKDLAGKVEGNLLYVPLLDARRMEVYSSVFNNKGKVIKETSAEIITPDSFSDLLADNILLFFGDGADKCRDMIKSENALFVPDFNVSARYMYHPSINALGNGLFEDVAYFEPFYLKEFIATKPSKKIPGL